MGVRSHLVALCVCFSLLGSVAEAEVMKKPGASVSAGFGVPITIVVSEEQKRFVSSFSSSGPSSYKMDIKLVERDEYEARNWIQKSLKNYGRVVSPLYVHFINLTDRIDGYNGKITVNVPDGIKNLSMFSLETNGNVRKIKFEVNKEDNTISFDVDKNDCYFVLVDEKVKTNNKKSKNFAKRKSSPVRRLYKSKPAKQKQTSDGSLTLGEILVSPWILLSSFFWYDDSRKKNINKAKRYRGHKSGSRYNQHRYLKYKGVRYK